MKKKDILIIAGFLVLALIAFAGYKIFNYFQMDNTNKYYAEVSVDGEVLKTFDITEDIEYTVQCEEGYNIIKIENGKVLVVQADCRDAICVNTKSIDKIGDSIICLPHKLVVRIVAG